MSRVKSFKPLINENSRVLILGSMPGVKSLEFGQYYAHPLNQFWKIIYGLFELPREEDYAKRVLFLLDRKIALWDTLESCHRKGSSDSDIRNEKPNDFVSLFIAYPNIKAVFFNGTKSYDVFRKKAGFAVLQDRFQLQLPSSSPANNMINFEEKLKKWGIILKFL